MLFSETRRSQIVVPTGFHLSFHSADRLLRSQITIIVVLTVEVEIEEDPPIPTKRPPLVGEVSAKFCG
jgi:hypothetical protein